MNSDNNDTAPTTAGANPDDTGTMPATDGQTAGDTVSMTTEEPPTAEEIAALRASAGKASENWDRYVRSVAELENFRKRAAREKQDAIRYANEGLLNRLISVLDNFEAALAAAGSANGTAESLKAGVAMISSQLKATLTEAGLEEVDATGQVFDPNWHEAVSQIESSEVPEGHVAQQIRKGYKFRDRLLRAATVIVAKAPASPASNPA